MINGKVSIRRLATSVPGLDAILGGGLPEYSFNLVSGPPGSGKTTLAHQIMFSLIAVAKLRGSPHSVEIGEYSIRDGNIDINERVRDYEGILSGRPMHRTEGATNQRARPA